MIQPSAPAMGTPSFPIEVAQQATAHQMGAFHAVHKPRISNPLAVIGIAVGIIVVDAILFVIALMAGWILYPLVVVPIVAIFYCFYGLKHANLRVYEFACGLIQARGSRLDVIRWEQVQSVQHELKRSNYSYSGGLIGALFMGSRMKSTYTVTRRDGAHFVFDNNGIHTMDALGQTIQREVTQAHMPQAIAAYDAGQPIPFGPLTLSQQGITNTKNQTLPWYAFRGISTDKGVVVVMQDGKVQKWTSVPLGKVANVGVLTDLANYAAQHSMRRA